jgi:hypothetical protein
MIYLIQQNVQAALGVNRAIVLDMIQMFERIGCTGNIRISPVVFPRFLQYEIEHLAQERINQVLLFYMKDVI